MATFAIAGSEKLRRNAAVAAFVSFVVLMSVTCALAQGNQGGAGTNNPSGPLKYFKNYILTGGDYAVGGWQKDLTQPVVTKQVPVDGVSTAVPYMTGTIKVPDDVMSSFFRSGVSPQGVPAGADVVAAFLYWQTVESSTQSAAFGQTAFFQSATDSSAQQYQITGTHLLSSSPVGWSSGGCTGASGGTKVIATYRADVLRFLDVVSGVYAGNNTYRIMLPDSGTKGNSPPFTLGATLVIVYRDVNSSTLDAVVIYDGSYSASNQAPITTQVIGGFYQPTTSSLPIAKLTHIVGNGQLNKSESVALSTSTGGSANLPSLYQSNGAVLPPFPGLYNGFWDNPTWYPNNSPAYNSTAAPSVSVVVGNTNQVTTATTTVTPTAVSPDCASWGAIVFKSDVQDTDGDGLLDIWESKSGLTDPNGNPLPDLKAMGADPNVRDIFTEIDYMCSALDANGACVSGAGQHSHKPSQSVLDTVGDAYSKAPKACFNGVCKGINIHFDIGNNYQGACSTTSAICPDPYIIQGSNSVPLRGGQPILETACTRGSPTCLFPDFAGTVGWKSDFLRYKNGDASSNLPAYFDHNRKDMFHWALFAHTLGMPRWLAIDQTLASVAVSGGGTLATIATNVAHLLNAGDFVSISGAPAGANLDGVYTVNQVLDAKTFTISIPVSNNAPDTTSLTPPFYQNAGLAVGNGIPRSTSGVGDPYGGDLMLTLGRWDNFTGTEFVQASTLMHELGHNIGLAHAGDYADSNNCKPNYQSIMNYLFQIAGLIDPKTGTAQINYSGLTLPDLDETNLSEQNGMNYIGLPYLPRWYAPASSAMATFLKMDPIGPLHCDGTPISSNETGMVRADGDTTTIKAPGSIDWNWSRTIDPGFLTQDINFNGTLTGQNATPPSDPFHGFDDWSHIKLNQVGARRNFIFSLDVGFNEDTGDALLPNSSPTTWSQITSDWSDTNVLGSGTASVIFGSGTASVVFGSGTASVIYGSGTASVVFGSGTASVVFGSGTASVVFGEQDVETASSNGNGPYNLIATATKFNIDLDWSGPHLGTVNRYEVWRGTCLTSACTINNSSPAIIGTVTPGVTPLCDGTHMFCDTNTKNNVLYLYFVEASITYPDGSTKHSGPSNIVLKSR